VWWQTLDYGYSAFVLWDPSKKQYQLVGAEAALGVTRALSRAVVVGVMVMMIRRRRVQRHPAGSD
jgi:hypothetical protein